MSRADGASPDGNLPQPPPRSATDILRFLTPRLIDTLASLHGTPESVAEAAVQLLPFGSRAALEALTPPLAVCGEPVDGSGRRSLSLTPFAYEVMAAAAARVADEGEPAPDWDDRFTAAARAVRDARRHP